MTDWIATDQSPNLFWSLANLPSPMCDLQAIEDVERSMYAFTEKPYLAKALDGTLFDQDWPRVIRILAGLRPVDASKSKDEVDSETDRDAATFVDEDIAGARKYLASTGVSASPLLIWIDESL